MRRSHLGTGALIFAASLIGCSQSADVGGTKDDDDGIPQDVEDAVNDLGPDAEVIARHADGMPMFIVGELSRIGEMQGDDAQNEALLAPALPRLLAPFRLKPTDLVLRRINIDENGARHFRYSHVHQGLPVIGSDLIVHADVKGAIFAINGTARGDLPANLTSGLRAVDAKTIVLNQPQYAGFTVSSTREVYFQSDTGSRHRAIETVVEGFRGQDPVRDRVYTDVGTQQVIATHPTIHFARNRRIHSANNGTSLPGTVRRTEGQAATTDVDVNANYDATGDTYDSYNLFWGRDSYDNAGALLSGTVHYSTNYCNAFWNGSQMVYGDGNASQNCFPLARSLDVTAHELTHAVTEHESGLIYSGESGGLNESYSDIFGAFAEAYVDGGRNGTLALSAPVWLIGDEVLPPFLRSMCDPAADGVSKDYWYSGIGGVDVHYSSGPANLAFCLLSRGGTHPRGATTNNVPAIGMDKAIRIWYKAQVDLLTANSNYAAARTAMVQAAIQLGYDTATQDAVGCAFAAIRVGATPTSCGGTPPPPPPPPPGDGVLTNNVPVSGIADATVGNMKFWKLEVPAGQSSVTFNITGGSGDADLYVQSGAKPTTTSYVCRPYRAGNVETCAITNPAAGTWWVGLRAYSAYSGVTLKGVYATTTPGGDPYLTNGVPVTAISGATGSTKYWRVAPGAGKTLRISISGGSGDADLYTRFGSRPTTSTYSCRPYLGGNNETCTTTNSVAGDYYVMLRGYTTYSNVSLVATY
ncbi:MAG TPA: M4 family metallopeptidase [Kofleriaceae bacterium]